MDAEKIPKTTLRENVKKWRSAKTKNVLLLASAFIFNE
jgi:hypothetical protein